MAAITERNDYWKRYLADTKPCYFPSLIESISEETKRQRLPIKFSSSNINGRVQNFCAQHELPLDTVLKTAWALVLKSYVGSGNLCFGSVISHNEMDLTSICNLAIEETDSVLEVARRIAVDAARSMPYQVRDMAEIEPFTGTDGRIPCNTALHLRTTVTEKRDDLDRVENVIDNSTDCDIIIYVKVSDESMEVTMDYSNLRLNDLQAANVASTYSHILSEILDDPSRTLAGLSLVGAEQLTRLMEWNNESPDYVQECVGSLFQAKVEEYPSNQAVHASDDAFTYKELDDLSTRLACHLSSRGVGPETIVLLCFDKSAWAVVGMMAVIKAGGAMLHFDASHPLSRLKEIQSQAKAKFLLTATQYSETWDWTGAEVFTVSRTTISELPAANEAPISGVRPENILYVIFTSGSTGKPKGCVIEHRNFLSGALEHAAFSGMNSETRVIQLASFTFDVSILETITALISGACVCIPGEKAKAKGLASVLNEFRISWAFLTPSLVKLIKPEEVPHLKFLVLGGEALTKDNSETWAQHLQLANGYGPTECSIGATVYPRLTPTTDPANIGWALGGVCWIVDPDNHNRLVPLGAPGELLIQGPIVARGYLNDPAKTNAVFIENPTWFPRDFNQGVKRFYKTGDLVRWNSNGSINFIGRKDSQVKLRGLRIELGEIEHHIAVHPLVKQAVVLLPKSGPCKNRLITVLALRDSLFPNGSTNSTAIELVDQEAVSEAIGVVAEDLTKHVPSYMQPTMWAAVHSIPLTTSAKMDRVKVAKWIAEMDDSTFDRLADLEEDEGETEPSTDMEEHIQDICATIMNLSVDRVRLNKSFITLGGDSILAMKLMGTLRAQGIVVSIQDILQSKSLVDLAASAIVAVPEQHSTTINFDLEKLAAQRLVKLGLSIEDVDEAYPITGMQRGMLLSQQRQSDSYELRLTCQVVAPQFQKELLTAAWIAVVARHSALRTIFVDSISDDGFYDQVVLKSPKPIISWNNVEREEDIAATLEFRPEEMSSAAQPPVRLVVSETATGTVYCSVVISHALVDGVSMLLLFRDLSLAYSQLLLGGEVMKYSRFLGHLQTREQEKDLGYWKNYLAGLAPCYFPVLNDDVEEPSQLHEVKANLDEETVAMLNSYCRKQNVTPAIVFQTAWALVLKTYTSVEDVCFGYLSAGRDAPIRDIQDTIGVYINMLICRLQLLPNKKTEDLVTEVRNAFFKGLPHQHCSLAEIQHGLSVAEPFFNTIMSLQSVLGEEIRGSDSLESVGFKIVDEYDPTEYDISVNIAVSKESVNVNMRHWTSKLNNNHAANVFETFLATIRTVLNSAQTQVSDLRLMTQRDKRQIQKWNADIPLDWEICVHDLVSEQVKIRPTASAVEAWDGHLTYQQLDDLSSALAQHLMDLGVGPEMLVPMCFDKSMWTPVAQLAVLKAGGACTAVDPSHPLERRNELLRQVQGKLAVTCRQNAHLFEGLVDHIVVVEPSLMEKMTRNGLKASTNLNVRPSNPAFVVFTSGSTGKPKGIVIEHHSMCASTRDHAPAMKYNPEARVLQFASYTFDVSFGETFSTLMCGGCICIPSEAERMDDLVGVINRMKANRVFLTPSVASLLQPSDVPGIEVLALGGESARQENVVTWAGKTHLANMYGPAETTIWSTARSPIPAGAAATNIGFGLASLSWITEIGNHNRLCSIGCLGELLIEGPIVARGYLADKEKTDAVFIANPAWMPAGGPRRRLYKTGDLAYYNSDGSVTCVGRRDGQVKIHGQRIEMGEIEHHLIIQENVSNAVVVVPKAGPFRDQLVALLSFRDSSKIAGPNTQIELIAKSKEEEATKGMNAIREYLSDRVPGYMMPSAWFAVDAIPLSLNGKTDRGRVSKWAETAERNAMEININISRTEAESPLEEALQRIWSLVLNVPTEQISFDQSFMSFGGDSITAMQVAARCRTQDIGITVRDVLKSKGIAQLAKSAKVTENDSAANGEDAQFGLLLPWELPGLEKKAKAMGLSGLNEIEDAYPCSPMQRGILISQAQDPEAYKVSVLCEVVPHASAAVSMRRLRAAWKRVVSRHAALRTVFMEGASGLYDQMVLKKFNPRIDEVSDYTTLQTYATDSPINYYEESVPPHRLSVCNDNGKIYFLLEVSHTLIDGGSTSVIFRDLASAYERELPAGPLYRDYISVLREQNKEESLAYWKNYLADIDPCQFPTLNEESVARELRTIDVTIPEPVKMQEFCKANNVTISNIFQLAWALFLRTYTGSNNVIFGYLASGRDVPVNDIENAVGPFINMLTCRLDSDDSVLISAAAQKIMDDYLQCLPHQHTSVADIQHALHMSGERLYNTSLSLQRPLSEGIPETSEIDIQVRSNTDPTEYDLTVSISAGDKSIEASISYWTNVLSEAQAARAASSFSHIISGILEQPSATIGELSCIAPEDTKQIITWNNNGIVPETVHACMHDIVAEQVLARPDAPAVCGDAEFTYAELDNRASRLANHLQDLGVGPEVKVPLCFDKSAWTIVAMLGVLKAGGAYCSMDPSHPVQHLTNVIRETSASIVLCSPQHAEKMKALVKDVVVVDQALFNSLDTTIRPLQVTVKPHNAAFISFTSGSTGKPKGIELKHSGFTSMVFHNKDMGWNTETRVFQFAAYTFDTSNAEIFGTLFHGGCVCVPSDQDRTDNIPGAMNRLKVNYTFLTPSVAGLVDPMEVPTLKTLALCGEIIREDLVAKWKDHVTIINSYGPAECTILTTLAFLAKGNSAASIGRGNGALLWVTDISNSDRLCPIGCAGELLVEGPILGRGYFDPEKTASSFINYPIWRQAHENKEEGGRMYKTGDMVRYAADGTVVYIGRKDGQVKLHGQRIEMGEIENHIAIHEYVQHALVMLPKSGPGQKRLVAVLSLNGFANNSAEGADPERLVEKEERQRAAVLVAEIRDQLATQVPSFMVPSVWLVIQNFTLTASKKLGRPRVAKWLEGMDPDAFREARDTGEEVVAVNATPRELQLQRVISNVLNMPLESIWLNSSFLSLGGDSISAMQVIVRCRAEGVKVTVKDLLRTKSISQLALCATASGNSTVSQEEALDVPFELSPIQQLYFNDITQGSTLPAKNLFNQSFLLRLTRDIQPKALEQALNGVVECHSMLRARFVKDNKGQWSQLIPSQSEGSYRFRVHEVVDRANADAITSRSQEELDIQNGPVFAADFIKISDGTQLLFLVAHHLVIDLVSWRVILKDIEESLMSETAITRTKPLAFQTWTKLQADYAKENLDPATALPHEVPAANYDFWGMEGVNNLRSEIDEIEFTLSEVDTNRLLKGCHGALNTETLDILLAALFQSFALVFDRAPPAVFNEGHGRQPWDSDIDVSETIGWFTTMFPLHVPATKGGDIIDTIRKIKDQRRQLPGSGWPYFTSRYLNEAGMKAFSKHTPIEILFNYLGQFKQFEQAEGLFRMEPHTNRDVGPSVQRSGLFDFNVLVIGGQTRFIINFNRRSKQQTGIRQWISTYEQVLVDTAKRLEQLSPSYTLSDFPLVAMTYPSLEKLEKDTLPALGVTRANIEDIYACSPMQEGILLSQTKDRGTYEYFAIFEATSPRGQVDVERLQAAWQQVVDRHPMLRTIFVQRMSDRPYDQIVLQKYAADGKILQIDDDKVIGVLENLDRLDYESSRPPHRLTISHTPSGKVFCKLEISHALIDGTSMAIIVSDFALAYQKELSAGEGSLYSNYISYLQAQPSRKALDYWTGHLSNVKPCQFPLLDDGIKAAKQLRIMNVSLPAASKIRQFCQAQSITLANVFRLAWALVLRSYTGSEQVCFGYLASGREVPVEGIDSAVGAFINMLVCSLDFESLKAAKGIDVLEELQEEYLTSLPHQHCSLAEIQHSLGIQGQSLFNTVLSFQRRSFDAVGSGEVEFKYLISEDPSEFDISIGVSDSDSEIEVSMSYLASRLSDGQAANVAGALSTVMASILETSDSKVTDLNLFGTRDKQQVGIWNNDCPTVIDECVHVLFQKQARLRPDAPAVSGDRNFTYKQLDVMTTQLAHQLVSLGVGPDVLVPICFEKSSWALVAMLAVMKAGGGYVPLDPSHPTSRLESIVSQLGSGIALVSQQTAKRLSKIVEKVVIVSSSSKLWLKKSSGEVVSKVSPKNIAYTLFTSGSTGLPKGVILDHSAVSSSCYHHGERIGYSHDTRSLQFSAYTFDACILEIFTTLIYGGCICVPSEADRMGNFAQAMTDMQVNTTFLTPSVVRLIQPDQVPTLKTLILGGEALGQDNITVWADKLKLMNGYGPTETCVFCIMNTFDTTKDRADVLGRAVSSVSWIVSPDNDNRLAPVGSVGTLLVQGPTLARGYLGDEKKTAQVFINAPAWLPNEAGTPTKLYKTGDLARYNSDGSITYLGRQDTQVKLRGQRIELAEIEHHVKDKLACAQQVGVEVIVPQGVKEKATLAAFLSLVDQPKETSGELFGEISESLKSQLLALQKDLIDVLPPYEIPTLYIPFRRMPTTTAGKLDRRAVRDAASQLSEAQLKAYSLVDASSKRKPETAMEKTMQKLWSDILKVSQDQIGADDSFFRLGGDSIMAMRLTATASAADISLSVSEIFRNVTLSEMAAVAVGSIPESNIGEPIGPFQLIPHVRSIEDIGLIAEQCNVEATQVEDAYPCTPLQEGLMALSIVKPGAYVGQKIFQFPVSMDISRFKNAWEVTFNTHPILRTRIIQTEGLGSLQVVLKEEIAWESADSLEVYLQHDKEDRIAYGKRLTRYGIVTAKDGYYFIWTAHHAMYDGWSLPLILEQVQQAYEHNLCTEAAGFNTFIKYLASTDPEASAQFWKEQFSGEKPTSFPQLPTASHQVHTNEQLTHSVRISRKTGSAILMSTVLRAAWAMVLAKYSDVQDVVFGVTLSGRNAPVAGVDKMLGPTITTVPVRIQLQQGRTVAQLLEEVQRQATEMIPHEQFGLQKISHLSEEAAHAVNFQNLLVIQPVSQFQTHGQEAMGAKEISLPLEDFDTYPLIMECSLSDNKVDIEMRFDSNVLPNHQIQRMLHHFEHIVWQLNDESNTIAVEDIDMFSQEDQNQISEWNRDYPEVVEDVVVSAFVEQVMARPEALAVDAWDGKFTYGELDVLSTKLAHYLVALGVGPEVLVPLCFDKSRWAILTQLSIMKAGGACVNLDPAHPLARLELIIQDSNAKVLLCAPQHAHLFESAGPQVVTIQQSLLNELPEKPKTQLPVIHPNNTAYVLFTSGSTGKPKGIVIEHGSLATSSKAHGTRWEIGPETRLLQFAAYTFDVSCADIFTSLQRGACICVPSEHDRMNDLAGAINKFRCNWAFLTPTVAGLLPAEGIPTLKKLVLGGEASTRDTIAKWHNVLDLIVCYGPAETSIYCSGAPPAKKDSDPANLGQAIGALYWIANPANHEKLTPVGCVGELLLEGRTVARGYLHDEVKTSAAFIQNPSWLPSASINGRPRRLYKTGDLVRYNSDGTIRFVGRKDTQTKVRGQRVELGEIEHAIRQNLPKLAHVIVDAVRLNERQAVVAFLHTTSDTHDENGTQAMPMDPEMRSEMISLQRALTESLPSYMIPNMFIPLSHVPLTMNGKADRRKLRELASSLTREQALIYSLEDAIKQEPTTEMEFKLRELWAQVIKVDATTIGAGDHFFRLGGDSILAMRLVGIAKSEGIQLTVGDVFRRPILADMASSAITVDQKTEIKLEAYKPFSLMEVASVDALVSDISAQIGRKEEEIADVLPATDFQQLAAVHAMLKTRGMLNYMFLDGDRKAPLDVELMESACKQMVKQNDILRTVFAPVGTDFVQVVLADPEISFQVYETFEDIESFSDNLCKEDLKAPLRLGDLFVKFMVVKKFRSSQHRLVMRISHAQYDGLSLPEMWKSLQGAFNGATSSEQSTSTPFSTYLTAAASIKTTESYQYWKDLLAGSTMTQIVAHSKPAYSNEYDSNIKRTIPNPSLGSSGATFASLLKAAWAVVLANATGKSDIVFGHVISGRNIPNSDADKIVGPCLNIVPVRVNLASSSTGLDLLNQVQEQQVSNIPFESLGFREITRSCTSWPSYTRFSSIVQHQNIDENWNISLGNAEYEIGNFCPGADEADLAIKSTPRGDQVEVQMVSSTKSVPAAVAEELLEKLCETIVEMAKSPEMQLPSETQLRKVEKKLPLSLPSLMSYNTDVTMPIDSVDIDNERGENIRKKVKAAWMQVLGSSEKEDFKIADNSSLFDCGGDLISVAALSVKLGVEVESLIDRDTLEEQVRMIMGLEFAKNGSLLESVKSLGSRFRSYFC